MNGGWLVLMTLGLGLLGLVVYVIMNMAGAEDRRARHAERRLDPFSDVTVTRC